MTKLTLVYRISTGLIVLIMGISAVSYLLRVPHFVESTQSLGYPAYLMSLLGVAKLLGLAALLVPGWPRLKEWAYAGFTINLIGATWSHLAVGQYEHAPLAVVWLAVLLTSYVTLRRRMANKATAAVASPLAVHGG
jgi:uncharacterized membrane protein YphA (DoxX/SURF4 family)